MKQYHDIEGNPISLYRLVISEPGWAVSRIDEMSEQLKNSTPNAKIQELIVEYGYDKANTHGFITDLKKLIGDV